MEEPPFRRLVAKVRREIVTFGPDVDQRLNQGRFLSPEQVHELAQSGRAVFLDTRNTYESAVGTFEGAVTPSMESFREFAQVVEDLSDRKQETIVAFCTGGIRCEKAVPYMVEKGFSNVFQIDGGILAYLEKYPDGAFKGDCFVFDDRYTITQDGAKGAWTPCPRCGEPEKDGICVICGTAARPARR
ncbi:MAG: hypothetical protein HY042_10140 [Spirochaetia bacterium]|nr:hypothetical protein [Spirochaetia bacterium]